MAAYGARGVTGPGLSAGRPLPVPLLGSEASLPPRPSRVGSSLRATTTSTPTTKAAITSSKRARDEAPLVASSRASFGKKLKAHLCSSSDTAVLSGPRSLTPLVRKAIGGIESTHASEVTKLDRMTATALAELLTREARQVLPYAHGSIFSLFAVFSPPLNTHYFFLVVLSGFCCN